MPLKRPTSKPRFASTIRSLWHPVPLAMLLFVAAWPHESGETSRFPFLGILGSPRARVMAQSYPTTQTPYAAGVPGGRVDGYSRLPQAPTNLGPASRPEGWVGSQPATPYVSTVPEPPYAAGPAIPVENAKVIAQVGDQVILMGEVLSGVNQEFAAMMQQVASSGQEVRPEEVERYRELLVQKYLQPLIETKLLVLDARRTIPEEGFDQILDNVNKSFEKKIVPSMIESAKVQTRAELDEQLRSVGSSLDRQKRSFADRTIAREWFGQKVNVDEEITHQEMLEYYQAHLADYEFSARARWEELMVRLENYRSPEEARRTLARAANRVLDGASWHEVATSMSEGSTAHEGGQRDWTTQGSLASTEIDRALFGLPVGAMSPILDAAGRSLHVVRVVERQEAGRKAFQEVQPEIKETIRTGRVEQEQQKYLAQLKASTRVWTIFDAPDNSPHVSSSPSSRPPISPYNR